MRKRLAVSLAMLATGAALLAAASFASPQGSTARSGGILRFSLFAGIENIDPQRSNYGVEWQYEWLTGRMLVTFAHKRGALGYRLVNDGAASYTISRDGRTYTFHIRRGMKLSNGARITSGSYKQALLRVLHPNVGSPLARFLTDPESVNIRGAADYNAGRTSTVPGIRTAGPYTLVIKLVAPNPLLATLLAVPPTGAISTALPNSPITSVSAGSQLPSGGRYYVQEYVPDRWLKIRKNRFYRPVGAPPTPGMADGFDYDIGVQRDQALLLVNNGQLDWAADGLAPGVWDRLFAQYGTTGRVRVFTTGIVDIVYMNALEGPFASVDVRKAVAWGIDRSALAGLRGARGAAPQCSLLSPVVPGYKKCTIYPNTPDLARARALARGHTHEHMILRFVPSASGRQWADLLVAQLNAIGFDNIELRPIGGFGRQPFDIVPYAWAGELPDPYFYVNALLAGPGSTFADPAALRLMRHAARIAGPKRFAAYGNLDLRLQREWAPVAVVDRRNAREFFSARIDPKSVVSSPVYELDLGRMAVR